MERKQVLVVFVPIVIIVVMYPIFHFLSAVFHHNWRIGWLLGLAIYWVIWGLIFSLFIIGRENIRRLITPQKPTMPIIVLVLFPLVMTALFKFIPGGMAYEKPNALIILLLISSAFGNGIFEEILWRGVYMKLFPQNLLLRIVWPSIWFGLWHYVPGSVNPESGHVVGLIIGALFLGFYSPFDA